MPGELLTKGGKPYTNVEQQFRQEDTKELEQLEHPGELVEE